MVAGGLASAAHDFVVLAARRVTRVDLGGRRNPERKSGHAVRRRRVHASRDEVCPDEAERREAACRQKRKRHQLVSAM